MGKSTDTKKKRGPKSTYNPDVHCNMAIVAGKAGMTDEEFAEVVGVSRAVLYEWKKNFPEFKKAFHGGKKYSDKKVIDSLYNRALGYDYEEDHVVKYRDGYEILRVKKHLAADITACIYWSKNRMPEDWKDRHDINLTEKIDYQKQRKKLNNMFSKMDKEK